MGTGRRRGFKSWFVEPYRQIKLGLMFFVLNMAFSILLVLVLGYYLYDVYKALTVYFSLSDTQGSQILDKLSVPMFIIFGMMLVFVVLTVLVSVKYTHEIYGPLVSINRFLDTLLDSGKAEPLFLRESDQLKDLALRLNCLSKRLDGKTPISAMEVELFLSNLIENLKADPEYVKKMSGSVFEKIRELITMIKKS
ncbi:MAG: hypothetical protein HQK54_03550 [Oligoflexales bacterium]|nr:hypothetical protein [Oligoflexales bacterium]